MIVWDSTWTWLVTRSEIGKMNNNSEIITKNTLLLRYVTLRLVTLCSLVVRYPLRTRGAGFLWVCPLWHKKTGQFENKKVSILETVKVWSIFIQILIKPLHIYAELCHCFYHKYHQPSIVLYILGKNGTTYRDGYRSLNCNNLLLLR